MCLNVIAAAECVRRDNEIAVCVGVCIWRVGQVGEGCTCRVERRELYLRLGAVGDGEEVLTRDDDAEIGQLGQTRYHELTQCLRTVTRCGGDGVQRQWQVAGQPKRRGVNGAALRRPQPQGLIQSPHPITGPPPAACRRPAHLPPVARPQQRLEVVEDQERLLAAQRVDERADTVAHGGRAAICQLPHLLRRA